MKKLNLIILILALFSINGISQDEIDADQSVSEFYDDVNNIQYAAYTKGNLFYLHLEIENPEIIRKIARQGLKVYIDSRAKKGKNFYIHYPNPPKIKPEELRKEMMANSNNRAEDRAMPPVKFDFGPDARISKYGKISVIKVAESNANLNIDVEVKQEKLIYDLVFPKNFIKTKKNKELALISIGLESRMANPNSQMQGPGGQGAGSGGRSGGGKPGGGSGQMSGGGGQRSGGGDRPSGAGQNQNSAGQIPKPFIVWYKIEI